ncbi:MAG: DMT family transporter [Bacteroidia bacterium]
MKLIFFISMNNSYRLLPWVILLALAFIWGSSFILMKRGLEVFSATQVASLRIFIAFISLIPFLIFQYKYMIGPKAKWLFLVGLFGNGIPAFLFTRAQLGLSSAVTGMLNSLTPLFTLILSVLVFQAKTKTINIVGVIIGLLGACGLIFFNGSADFSGSIGYAIYVVIATLMYAVSVNVIKKHLQEIDSVVIASCAFSFVGPLSGVYLFSGDFISVVKSKPESWKAMGYISVLAVIGSAFSVIIFNRLIKMTNALFASSVTYLIPVVAMFWGALDGEQILFIHFVWISIILAGVYLVNVQK